MADCLMAKFTRKEIKVANILLELVDIIPQFDRQNPRLTFPTWNTKRNRYLPCRSHFSQAELPIFHSNTFFLHPDFMASSPSFVSPPANHPNEDNSSKRCKDGIIIDLNKDPEEILAYEGLNPSPSEKPFIQDEGSKDEIFIEVNMRNSKEGVLLGCDKLEVEIITDAQSSKPILEQKRKREE